MKLFTKEEINKTRKDQTRELTIKNEKLVKSLRKTLALQKEIDLDSEKAKKVKDYEVWCAEIHNRMDKELQTLKAYEKLVEDKKEEYYNLVSKIDAKEETIFNLDEEIKKLKLQVEFNKTIIIKSSELLHS